MPTPKLGSILLSSSKPDQLRDWYRSGLQVDVSRTPGEPAYDVLDCGGFYIMLDRREDVGDSNPEPGRVILNFEVDDARAVAERIDGLGGQWLAGLEDRDGSWFATAIDPDGNYVQIIQLSQEARAAMEAG